MKQTVFQTLNKIFETVYRLLLLHFLWMTGTALGAVVFGIGPSTAALFSVLRKRRELKNDRVLFKVFKDTYINEFKEATVLFYIAVILGTVIFLNISFLLSIESAIRYPFLIVLFILAYIYLSSVAVLFPISVHYDIGLKNKLIYTLKFGIGYSIIILFTWLLAFLSYAFMIKYAIPLIILFGIVPAAYLLSELSRYLFIKVDTNNLKDRDKDENNY